MSAVEVSAPAAPAAKPDNFLEQVVGKDVVVKLTAGILLFLFSFCFLMKSF